MSAPQRMLPSPNCSAQAASPEAVVESLPELEVLPEGQVSYIGSRGRMSREVVMLGNEIHTSRVVAVDTVAAVKAGEQVSLVLRRSASTGGSACWAGCMPRFLSVKKY